MISGFGAHYRLYRLASALDRLRDLPPNTQISLAKAGRLLGMKETDVRTLLQRHAPHEQMSGIGLARQHCVTSLCKRAIETNHIKQTEKQVHLAPKSFIASGYKAL